MLKWLARVRDRQEDRADAWALVMELKPAPEGLMCSVG